MDRGTRHSLVLAGAGWHPGVLGIVASRIVEKYYRPTIVIGLDGSSGKGSARSIRGFHMVEGFRRTVPGTWKNSAGTNLPVACRLPQINWSSSPKLSKRARAKRSRRRTCCRCSKWTRR